MHCYNCFYDRFSRPKFPVHNVKTDENKNYNKIINENNRKEPDIWIQKSRVQDAILQSKFSSRAWRWSRTSHRVWERAYREPIRFTDLQSNTCSVLKSLSAIRRHLLALKTVSLGLTLILQFSGLRTNSRIQFTMFWYKPKCFLYAKITVFMCSHGQTSLSCRGLATL